MFSINVNKNISEIFLKMKNKIDEQKTFFFVNSISMKN